MQTNLADNHGDVCVDGLDSPGQIAFFLEDLFGQLLADLFDEVFVCVLLHRDISLSRVNDALSTYQEI